MSDLKSKYTLPNLRDCVEIVDEMYDSKLAAKAAKELTAIDAPTPSLDDVVKAALEWAADNINCGCGRECFHPSGCPKEDVADFLDAASDPATIAAIIKTAGGKKDE